jgi:threonine dehydratase
MILREEIEAAYRRIEPHVRQTPVIALAGDSLGIDAPLTLKLELMQHTASFKVRGAFNSLITLEDGGNGVAAASGGNHGAAVAYAARALGVPAHIFVPEVSSPVKIERIRAYGSELHIGGAAYSEALTACERFVAETGAISIHAYDQPSTLAGQGTVALEWSAQAPDLDTVLIAVGGGGLIGGMAAWYRERVKIVAVEPATSCCLHTALAAGRPSDVAVCGIAVDSLGARRVGELMFPIAQTYVNETVLVEDDAIARSQRVLWEELRITAEPGGATALAALLSGAYRPAAGEKVGVLICGGNADPTSLAAKPPATASQ